MGLIDEILSSAPEDIKSAPEDVRVAYTALRVVFGLDLPLNRLIRRGHRKSKEDETYNGYTNYAVDLLDFLNRKPSDYGGILQHLESFAELLENYAIAKAYDKSEDVRRAVDIIEGDARVPRDVRELMRRIKDSETREMLYNLVDSVILKPLEKLGKGEKLEEVTERLNKLVGYAKVSLTFYGKLLTGELDGKVGPHLYDHIGNESVSGRILNFGWMIKDDVLHTEGKIKDIGEYRSPTHNDWARNVEILYEVTKGLMGICAETLEKYINV